MWSPRYETKRASYQSQIGSFEGVARAEVVTSEEKTYTNSYGSNIKGHYVQVLISLYQCESILRVFDLEDAVRPGVADDKVLFSPSNSAKLFFTKFFFGNTPEKVAELINDANLWIDVTLSDYECISRKGNEYLHLVATAFSSRKASYEELKDVSEAI